MCVSNISLVAEYPDDPESRWFGEGQTKYGPYEYNGNLYTIHCVNDLFGGSTKIAIFRSTDGGITWAAHNSLTTPGLPDRFSRDRITVVQASDILYFVYLRRNTGVNFNYNLAVGKYDISLDTITHTVNVVGPHVSSDIDKADIGDTIPVSNRLFASCYVASQDAIYTIYSNIITDPTLNNIGFNYYYTKVGCSKYVIGTDTWTTSTPFPQTGTKTYGGFDIIQGSGSLLHAFLYDFDVAPLVGISPISPTIKHYSLNFSMALQATETVHNSILAAEELHASRAILLNDGAAKIAIGIVDSSLDIKLFEGLDQASPGFTQVTSTLGITDVDGTSGSVYESSNSSIWLLGELAIHWNTNYNVFVGTITDGGADPFVSKLWRVEYTSGVWTPCLILDFSTVDVTESWISSGIFVYPNLTPGTFISWGYYAYYNGIGLGNFYTALISDAENLSVSVSDTLVFADGLLPVIPFSPTTGIVVETCPEVIISSEFCSNIKTSVDTETQIHDCEEVLYAETTQPCEELANNP